ncbi:MAG: hypothetical protein Q8N62_03135 [Candidatus Omnitrophota bacterium]|nr:hypothetical protein [Candidatus Omnitrophota bacterium]
MSGIPLAAAKRILTRLKDKKIISSLEEGGGSKKNLRSFLYVGNLVDAIGVCVEHPKAVGETFLVSDGQDVSTVELIRMIGGGNLSQVKTRGRVYFSCFRFWKNRNVPYSWKNRNVPCSHQGFAWVEGSVDAGRGD